MMTTPDQWGDDQTDELEGEWASDETFDGEINVADDVNEGQRSQFALLSDGSAVKLTGPGAGSSIAAESVDESSVASRLPTRDEALSGRTPLLLIHRASQRSDLLPRLMAGIVASTAGRIPLASVVPLPRSTVISNRDWLSDCAAASVRIADPAGFKLDGTIIPCDPPSSRSLRWYPYFGDDPLVVGDVLDAQRQVGSNLLLSPGRVVDPADPQNSLDRVFAEADQALTELQSGERLALNLTLPRVWLTRSVLRDQLLAQLLDQEQFDVWYIRVQWASSLRSTEQPTDIAMLEGYKRLAQLAADEERVLLLPQSGLTGWFQLAFGATGFGSGLPGSDQAFKEPINGGPPGGVVPIERYFEPTLLHSVERTVHDVLSAQAGYIPCSCPYCPSLHSSSNWQPGLAQLHHLHWTGRLAADAAATARGGPGGAVRRAVRTAFVSAGAQLLAGPSEPRHLGVWDRLL